MPRFRASTWALGVIFVDEHSRVLIVKTTYKPTWEVPGGSVDQDESLLDAAVRELKEELSLQYGPNNYGTSSPDI